MENLAGGLRLAFFRHPATLRFHVTPAHFIALVATWLAIDCASAFALAGFGGFFNPQALPSALFWVLLALFAGHLIGRVGQDETSALRVPIVVGTISIALTIASSAIWFAEDQHLIRVPVAIGPAIVDQLLFGWWALAIFVASKRLSESLRARTALPAAIVALVVLVPVYLLPAEPLWQAAPDTDEASHQPGQQHDTFTEHALYAQPALLQTALQQIEPGRAGVENLYFVGFAPSASQDVFMKETLSIQKLMEDRFGARGRAISLISHPSLIDRYPIATLTSLRETLRVVGARISPDDDVVLLYMTSHGSEKPELSVEFPPLQLQAIRPEDLRSALDDAGIKWRIVVISACYSGGFVDALKDPRTLVVTASDAMHTSFGCGNAFDFTYFSKAFFDEALRQTTSFEKAFAMASQAIGRRERKEGLEASNPQIVLGKAMRSKLSGLERRLSMDATHAK